LLLKAETKIRRKRCFNQTRSRLDSRTAEILAMKNAGLVEATLATDLGLGLEQQDFGGGVKVRQGLGGLGVY
ncbi:hypothetical protein, partial [Aeromonas caviae]|uniref:hypothetical protein n=1 Tax=Aeromonas caviae TaxID=648 RepID=UPI001FC7FD7E